MNTLRSFLARIRFSRQESVALAAVFGLYLVGLSWRYVQKTSVPFDSGFYARVDSAMGANALAPFPLNFEVPTDTVPKPRKKQLKDSTGAHTTEPDTGLQMDAGRMNVNRATIRQLTLLPGIGPSLAQRIVEYREASGPLRSVSDLLNVKGIGPRTLAKFEGMIVVE